jgi:hypothetical protein
MKGRGRGREGGGGREGVGESTHFHCHPLFDPHPLALPLLSPHITKHGLHLTSLCKPASKSVFVLLLACTQLSDMVMKILY